MKKVMIKKGTTMVLQLDDLSGGAYHLTNINGKLNVTYPDGSHVRGKREFRDMEEKRLYIPQQ